MVVLSRITTQGGDEGMTHLGDMTRVPKADPLIEAIGAVAEANAAIGLARAHDLGERVDGWAQTLQQQLFDLGADLATPLPSPETEGRPVPRISSSTVAEWEEITELLASELGPLRSFVLPGGPPAAAYLHFATTVVRRAERAAWRAAAERGIDQPGGLARLALIYLNRISDVLFQMARSAAAQPPELWHHQ
ncbi:MAG: cob(I)yrinic acid a,c-diamide adenosyltransferase [Bifidobacteriaceae bacterium]|jgi:cob(I)alamin adenosyltransferase|nr:cob(I)yrinic acid a,c-diamide adenosyltransferase [Bifidobacteriaceae bacterium]